MNNTNQETNNIKLDTWSDIWERASNEIDYKLTLVSVQASGWALGKSDREIEAETKRRMMEKR